MANHKFQRKQRRIVLLVVLLVLCLFFFLGKNSPIPQLRGSGTEVVDWINQHLNEFFGLDDSELLTAALENPLVSVYMLDVGQGEAYLIRTPEGDMLLDGGETGQGEVIVRYLRSLGIDRLSLVINTHPHSDHIGGLAYVIEQMEVDQVLIPEIPDALVPTSRSFTNFLEAVERRGCMLSIATPGSRYTFGEQVSMMVLGFPEIPQDLNNLSLILRLDSGENSFLFTGDLEEWGEERLLEQQYDLDIDVLSVGHHGSTTSTSKKLMNATTPKLAIISCGIDNPYGHPHLEILRRLSDNLVELYRTDLNGTVIIESDGTNIAVISERGEDLFAEQRNPDAGLAVS